MNSQDPTITQYLKKHGFATFTPKAVLFDMDGVLYDSMPNHAQSWQRAMTEFGLHMTGSDAYKYEGMRGVETIKLLARDQWHRELGDAEAQQMYAVKTRYFSQCPPAPKMAGVELLMQKIKASGLTIGVVTGSGQHTLLDTLTTAFNGLLQPQFIVTSFDVSHGKPAPDPYLKGLEKCGGLQPWEAIVVENAPLGVRAAQAARIFTIAVNTGVLPNQLLADEGADLIFNSMNALSDEWERLWH
jgi:HAD superfamily hydrolase (TIGR01509 family)